MDPAIRTDYPAPEAPDRAVARTNRVMRALRAACAAAFAVLLVLFLPKLEFENSLDRWVPPDSPAIGPYRDFLDEFGGDGLLLVAFHDPGGFAGDEARAALMTAWDELSALPGVTGASLFPPPLYRMKRPRDETVTTFMLTFAPPSHLDPNRPELLEAVRGVLKAVPLESHLAGTGVLHEAINEETRKYTGVFIVLGLAFLFLLLLAILKSPRAFLMTVGVSVGGVSSLLLTAAILDIPLSMVTVILPVLVLFYGTSSSLHVLFHRGDFRLVMVPCFLAILTTGIGFLTFLPSAIPLMRDFAALGVAGILGGFGWAFLLFYPRQYSFDPRGGLLRFFRRFPVVSRPLVLALFLAAGAAMVPGLFKVTADIYSLDVISPSNERVRDHRFIEERVSRYVPLEYTVEIGRAEPAALNDWISTVLGLDQVDGAVSYLNVARFTGGAGSRYVSRDGRLGRITFLIPILSTREGLALVERIDALAAVRMPGVRPRVNGYVTLYAVVAEELRRAFVGSLASAFAFVFLVMALFLRDLRLFLASILPNALPVVFIIGLMGWTGLTLNMATVPIGCLMLGILVDNTIHILFWYKKHASLREAFDEVAPGMFLNTLVLAVGFAVFLFAASPPIRYFGTLSILALGTGLLGDGFLLPVLVRLTAARGRKETEHA
jgi:predicted RND superfamily exporter protein